MAVKSMTKSEIARVASGTRSGENLMTKAVQKITLSPWRDIPFNKLVLSQSNVRRIKFGVSVEELAGGHRPTRPLAKPERAVRVES